LLPTIEMMAALARPTHPDTSKTGPPGLASFGDHATLGDFRVGREIGRGGMGVVYEAEQVSLRRRVALKVLPVASAVEPRQLRRFQVEVQAAAYLNHPNIVPVYAVGYERPGWRWSTTEPTSTRSGPACSSC
jgi:eukaryotic-like serine/threonine-protein kinase